MTVKPEAQGMVVHRTHLHQSPLQFVNFCSQRDALPQSRQIAQLDLLSRGRWRLSSKKSRTDSILQQRVNLRDIWESRHRGEGPVKCADRT